MIAVLGISLCSIVKQWKSDLLPLLRIALTLVLGALILSRATPILSFLRVLTSEGTYAAYTTTLFQALGIAILSQICADVCRESGESGLAGSVELTGKVEILLLCLPLMEELLSTARELFEMGGGIP